MYRQSNDRYSENNQINSMSNYPPIPNIPKMHSHLEGYNPPPMPVYYDTPQPYQFAQQPPPGSEGGYDSRFSNWREVSQSKNAMIVNPNLPPMGGLSHYGVGQPLHMDPYSQPKNMQPQNFPPVQNNQIQPPQMNVLQRISGVVKSQLSYIHSIMLYADRKTQQQKNKKERDRSRQSRQRSRSRDRDRGTRGNIRDRQRERERQKHHREWNCSKCSFLNFDFRDRCKRCNEAKPESLRSQKVESGGKNYVPGPDDWRCSKCGNINYARRIECHRCRNPRNK